MLKIRRAGIVFVLIAILAIFFFLWWPFQRERPFLRIPILFLEGVPCIQTMIEGNSYFFALDSGSSGYFSMQQEVLDAIKDKTITQARSWIDVQGNQYNSPSFFIKEIDIESFKISNAVAFKEEMSFVSHGSRIVKQLTVSNQDHRRHECQGRIGSRTLRILDYWLLDFPNSELFAIRNIEKIKENPRFSFKGFAEVRLERSEAQIILCAETDFGNKRFALDTGACRSILNPPSDMFFNHQLLKLERFTISGCDFSGVEFYLYKLPDDFRIDGILGLDFFQKHAIYLDFKKNRAFIGPEQGVD